MWDQVNGVYKELREVLTAPGEGVTLICYSQGKKCHLYDMQRNVFCIMRKITITILGPYTNINVCLK